MNFQTVTFFHCFRSFSTNITCLFLDHFIQVLELCHAKRFSVKILVLDFNIYTLF